MWEELFGGLKSVAASNEVDFRNKRTGELPRMLQSEIILERDKLLAGYKQKSTISPTILPGKLIVEIVSALRIVEICNRYTITSRVFNDIWRRDLKNVRFDVQYVLTSASGERKQSASISI